MHCLHRGDPVKQNKQKKKIYKMALPCLYLQRFPFLIARVSVISNWLLHWNGMVDALSDYGNGDGGGE